MVKGLEVSLSASTSNYTNRFCGSSHKHELSAIYRSAIVGQSAQTHSQLQIFGTSWHINWFLGCSVQGKGFRSSTSRCLGRRILAHRESGVRRPQSGIKNATNAAAADPGLAEAGLNGKAYEWSLT